MDFIETVSVCNSWENLGKSFVHDIADQVLRSNL